MNRLFSAAIPIISLSLTLISVSCSKPESANPELQTTNSEVALSAGATIKAENQLTSSSNESSADSSNESGPSAEATGNEQGDLPTPEDESSEKITYTEVEWTDLLPDEDLQALENPPEYLAEIEDGSENDQLSSQLKNETPSTPKANGKASDSEVRYQQALTSKKIRPEFNGRYVRIPGFIVPLQFDDHQTITTFFLVPFFGACIHMPPPPPNQIIYAEYEPGIKLAALYDPFWIDGKLSTTLMENDMATAAYSIDVASIEPYVEHVSQ